MIAPETLRELISYDRETGALTWLERPERMFKSARDWRAWNTLYAGKPALNSVQSAGYRRGAVFGQGILAHRAAWAIAHGVWPDEVDHINGNRQDNRLGNLRSVTPAENRRNSGMHPKNRSGFSGVHQRKADGKWLANILVDGKTVHLGLFETLPEAAAARHAAERLLGYHRNHGKRPSHGDQGAGGANNLAREVAA